LGSLPSRMLKNGMSAGLEARRNFISLGRTFVRRRCGSTWASVRNASDPQIQDKGLTPKQGYELATSYYEKYGYWTTIPSAITCWTLILEN
jgi:hypothetical protein